VNPSMDVRIASMISAMVDVVIPQLGPDAGLAGEQAALVVAHLHVLRTQVDQAGRFERWELEGAQALGTALVSAADGGQRVTAASEALSAAVVTVVASTDPADVRAATETINAAAEALIQAVAIDGSAAFAEQLPALVIEHERVASDANRSLFASMGWERPDVVLEPIESLLAKVASPRG
jgi:hypothetical protein